MVAKMRKQNSNQNWMIIKSQNQILHHLNLSRKAQWTSQKFSILSIMLIKIMKQVIFLQLRLSMAMHGKQVHPHPQRLQMVLEDHP